MWIRSTDTARSRVRSTSITRNSSEVGSPPPRSRAQQGSRTEARTVGRHASHLVRTRPARARSPSRFLGRSDRGPPGEVADRATSSQARARRSALVAARQTPPASEPGGYRPLRLAPIVLEQARSRSQRKVTSARARVSAHVREDGVPPIEPGRPRRTDTAGQRTLRPPLRSSNNSVPREPGRMLHGPTHRAHNT